MKKIVSIILILTMLMTISSQSAFSASYNGSGGATQPGRGTGSDGWKKVGGFTGYRISVYFACRNDDKVYNEITQHYEPLFGWGENDAKTGKPLSFPVGKSMDFRAEDVTYAPASWGTFDIYKYITKGEKNYQISTRSFAPKPYEYVVLSNNMAVNGGYEAVNSAEDNFAASYRELAGELSSAGYDDLQGMLDMLHVNRLGPNNIGIPAYSDDGDISAASSDFRKAYFTNPWVLNCIAYYTREDGRENAQWNANDFAMGTFTWDSGYVSKGQYKIFIEPLYYAYYDGWYSMQTLREMIVHYQSGASNSLLANGLAGKQVNTRIRTLVNAAYLDSQENILTFPSGEVMGRLLNSESKRSVASNENAKYVADNVGEGLWIGNYMGVNVMTSPKMPTEMEIIEETPPPEAEEESEVTVKLIDRSSDTIMEEYTEEVGTIDEEIPSIVHYITVPMLEGYSFEDWHILLPDGTNLESGMTSNISIEFNKEQLKKVVEIGYQPINEEEEGTKPNEISDCKADSITWTEKEQHTYSYTLNGLTYTGTCTHTYKYKVSITDVDVKLTPDTLKSGYGFEPYVKVKISSPRCISKKKSSSRCGKSLGNRTPKATVTPPTDAEVHLGYTVKNSLGTQGRVVKLSKDKTDSTSSEFSMGINPISVLDTKEIFTDIWLAGTKENPVKHYVTVKLYGGGVNGKAWCTTAKDSFTINGDMYEDDGTTDGV